MLVFVYIVLLYLIAFIFWILKLTIKKQFKSKSGTINQITFVKSPNYKRNIKRIKFIRILVTVLLMAFIYCGIASLFQASILITIMAQIALIFIAMIRIYYFIKIRKLVLDYKDKYPFNWIKAPKFRLSISLLLIIIILCIIEAFVGSKVIIQISSKWLYTIYYFFG